MNKTRQADTLYVHFKKQFMEVHEKNDKGIVF